MKIQELRTIAKILGVKATDGRRAVSIYKAIREFHSSVTNGRERIESVKLKRAYRAASAMQSADNGFKIMLQEQIQILKKLMVPVMFEAFRFDTATTLGVIKIKGENVFFRCYCGLPGTQLCSTPKYCQVTFEKTFSDGHSKEAVKTLAGFVESEYSEAWDAYTLYKTGTRASERVLAQ
jgi:hypothetical protein